MSDPPTPPEASGDAPAPTPDPGTPETSAPRPRSTIPLAGRVDWRPKLRWFAAEIVVVVAGVLIALALNAWWGARQGAAREQEYLHQLVEDLQETETLYERIERGWTRQGASAGKLLRPYRSSSKPPADSMLQWMGSFVFVQQSTFVTGTATALVETGDLNLIRSDSLRSAITGYLGRIDMQVEYDVANSERIRDHLTLLRGRVDMIEAALSTYPPGRSDSLARADPAWPVPEAPERAFAPLDVEAFYRDREVYTALVNVMQFMYSMRLSGAQTLAATVALREQIEAELTR
jgi:hypothetical protein